LERGSNEAKRKAFEQNIEKGYQKSLKHPFILRACLHVEHPYLKHSYKKEKATKIEPKRMSRILMPSRGAT
jgi:hypothetical protein